MLATVLSVVAIGLATVAVAPVQGTVAAMVAGGLTGVLSICEHVAEVNVGLGFCSKSVRVVTAMPTVATTQVVADIVSVACCVKTM